MKKSTLHFIFNLSTTLILYAFCQSQSLIAAENESTLTLETAMNMAENFDFSARIATNSETLSQSKADEQFRSMLPNISLSGNYLKYSDTVNKAVGNSVAQQYGYPDTTVSSAGFTLTQPLVGLIPLYFSLQSASAQAHATMQSKEYTKSLARFLGANSFINAVKAVQLLNVAESGVQIANTQLHDANAQFNAGKLTNADVLKFKLSLENSQTSLMQAQTTAKITFVTLAETIGVKNISQITLPKKYESVWETQKANSTNLTAYINKAMSMRNDLLSSKSNIESAKFSKYFAESSYLPSVNFVSNYSRNFQAKSVQIPATTSTSAINLDKSDVQDTLYYGLQFTWNILDWGVRQAQISEAVAKESTANIQEEQMESQIKIDVTNSFLKLQDAYQTLDSAKVSVEYAKDVFQQMEAQFNNGQATTTDVLAASNDQTSALAKLANAIGDLDLAWLTLQKSIGDRLTTLDK